MYPEKTNQENQAQSTQITYFNVWVILQPRNWEQVADIYEGIERALQKWTADCCTIDNWEIPFPQLTVHRIEQEPL